MSKQRLVKGIALAVLGAAVGCTDLPSTEPTPEDTGTVELALVVVPTDVQCIHIVATGSRVREQNFAVMSGQMSVLSMTGLPVGPVTFSGEAFPGGCGGPAMMALPTYVADPVSAQIGATGVTSLALNMRRNGQASISVDFETGGTCGPAGSVCSPAAPNACCAGLSCQGDPAGQMTTCQPQNMCAPAGTACAATTVCCAGLTCQGDPTGLLSCQPQQNMCAPAGTACAASTVCCSGLACQGDATGLLSCQPLPTCRPPGAMCGPGLNAQCCAGLMCVVDPAAQTAICQ